MTACVAFNLLSPLCTEAFAAIAARVLDSGARKAFLPGLREASWPELLRQPAPWLAFGCGWHYVQARKRLGPTVEAIVAPVLADARYDDRPGYFSELVVRVDAPYERLEELSEASCAFNEERSFSGCILPAASLVRRGWSRLPFARLVRAGSHRQALDWVAQGLVDAAPVDSWVLDLYRRAEPASATRLRVLDRFGPAPPPPVFGRSVPRERLRAHLVGMSTSSDDRALLPTAGIARFVPTSDHSYDPLREAILVARSIAWTGCDGQPPDCSRPRNGS
jgi:phosphonate transport system substrate-binding protein